MACAWAHPSCPGQGSGLGIRGRRESNSCQRALRTLAGESAPAEKVQAIVTMPDCGNLGAETLVSFWQRPNPDIRLLRSWTVASAEINDRRTYRAARAALVDPSRSESFRLAALEVLVAGFDPSMAVTFPTPTKPMYSSYVGTGFINHRSTAKGPQTVGVEARGDLILLLKQLVGSDPNERIRKVAAELGPTLERRRLR